jgi:hypothetical protein
MHVTQGTLSAHVPTPHNHPQRARLTALAALAFGPENLPPATCVECGAVLDLEEIGFLTIMCDDCYHQRYGRPRCPDCGAEVDADDPVRCEDCEASRWVD